MEYVFIRSKQIFDTVVYDIAGGDFKELIDLCCKYCKYFSFNIRIEDKIHRELLSPFEISGDGFPNYIRSRYIETKYYMLCDESRDIILGLTDSIYNLEWSWKRNPEGLTFFREDKSIFFSTAFYGEYLLSTREGEDVSNIVSKEGWAQGRFKYVTSPNYKIDPPGATSRMKIQNEYIFYDSDFYTGDGEFDIIGDDLKELIDLCCKYCKYFSFGILPDKDYNKLLSPFEVPGDGFSNNSYSSYTETKYYRLCEESKNVILSLADSLFAVDDKIGYFDPADPIFYREDKSVFFASLIHEGECSLFPRDDEDVSHVISKENWNVSKKLVVEYPPYD